MAQRQIVGGAFQDGLGNPLSDGYITIRLMQDALISGLQVYASTIITIPLDSNGNVSGTVNLWPTDQMTPSTDTYIVKVFNANGQLAWGPHGETLPSGAGTYDLSNWTTTINAI